MDYQIYNQMQKRQYDSLASEWTPSNRDPVVGTFDLHNQWKDYSLLFEGLYTEDKIALDFGCGPGRGLVEYSSYFKSIDGVDISSINLDKAIEWCEINNLKVNNLYLTTGNNLENIVSEIYDVVYSTICLQHICVHSIRYNLMKEFFRVLKPGGWFTAQMGYGPDRINSVPYLCDNYTAGGTNGECDTRVESPTELKDDLESIGFTSFSHKIRPVGPGDRHNKWIFFRAQKPNS